MIRSSWKVPFVAHHLLSKIAKTKKTGKQEAIHKGLEIFGPRMIWYLEQLNKFKADSDLCQSDGTDTKQTIYV